ncbi:MAG: formate dehydrogenase iron-sulfur subunit, partial [Actinomycetota bacterium]|nr:formate dehydrogenase iron-sulfur subunit [Actinomycetota bacterium]
SAAHTPLAVMLVLSQLAVGAYLAGLSTRGPVATIAAVVAALAAMGASVTHLGRPHLAWRAFIGIRHSWVSREILALSAFAGLAAVHALLVVTGREPSIALTTSASVSGIAAVACSVAIYAATGRRWWRAPALGLRFGTTVALSALAVALIAAPHRAWVGIDMAVVTGTSLAVELAVLRHRREPRSELGRTAVLLTGALSPVLTGRVLIAILGGVVAPTIAVGAARHGATGASVVFAVVSLMAIVAAALLERHLMFTASAAPRMPGTPR